MAENKRYYYMRLKEDFFDDTDIVALESMPDGILYSNILLKLYLKSLRDEGRLMLRGAIPYSVNMIAAITRQKEETVEKALEIFKRMNLIEILDSGAIYMLEIQSYIGKSSTEADRVREFDRKRAAEKSTRNDVEIYEKSTPENRDKSIENREYIGADKPPTPTRKKYGKYGWVKLTDSDYNRLLNDLGQAEAERCIAYVDESAQSTGNKNRWRDWNLVVRRCHRDHWGMTAKQEGGKADELPFL